MHHLHKVIELQPGFNLLRKTAFTKDFKSNLSISLLFSKQWMHCSDKKNIMVQTATLLSQINEKKLGDRILLRIQ